MNDILQKNLWLILLVLGLGFYAVYLNNQTPCKEIITYSIGRLDSGFDLTEAKLKEKLLEAESIWEKPTNRNIFEYREDGDITINFIYDSRQKATEERTRLLSDANKVKKLATGLKDEFQDLNTKFDTKSAQYKTYLNEYKLKQASFNQTVSAWNRQGGAPTSEFDKLNAEKTDLEVMYRQLELERTEINALVDQINEFGRKYNVLISDVNSKIETINETAGKEFQEGTFDPNTNTITIYEFESDIKLIRVLAHEFGHALTLDHNSNENSIMYELNKSSTLSASHEDIASLNSVCKL